MPPVCRCKQHARHILYIYPVYVYQSAPLTVYHRRFLWCLALRLLCNGPRRNVVSARRSAGLCSHVAREPLVLGAHSACRQSGRHKSSLAINNAAAHTGACLSGSAAPARARWQEFREQAGGGKLLLAVSSKPVWFLLHAQLLYCTRILTYSMCTCPPAPSWPAALYFNGATSSRVLQQTCDGWCYSFILWVMTALMGPCWPSLPPFSISKFDERSAFLYVLHNAEDFQIYFCTEMHCKRSVH